MGASTRRCPGGQQVWRYSSVTVWRGVCLTHQRRHKHEREGTPSLNTEVRRCLRSARLQPILDMLPEDVEVFDHVPYRFDGKALFAKYLNEVIASLASASFGFRQPSCRMYSDEVGIVNAHDMFTGVTKDGKVLSIHGRTTLVFIKQSGQWKIVSAHFSAIPKAL
jgi:ketosteroid isomerase-like protein